MMLSARTCAAEVLRVMTSVADSSLSDVESAAELFAECVRSNGVIHAFGTGHSAAVALEVSGRAGGLVPSNRISLVDLVTAGGADPAVLSDPLLERRADIAPTLYALAAPQPQDLFVIVSNSGVNGSVVELAHLVTSTGHRLIALTSLAHTMRVRPTHTSGKRLVDLADVTLDNGAPYGDALLPMPDGSRVCAISMMTASLLVQMVVAEALRRLAGEGRTPPVYVSSNVPGGHERNTDLEQHYAGRIRRMAY